MNLRRYFTKKKKEAVVIIQNKFTFLNKSIQSKQFKN